MPSSQTTSIDRTIPNDDILLTFSSTSTSGIGVFDDSTSRNINYINTVGTPINFTSSSTYGTSIELNIPEDEIWISNNSTSGNVLQIKSRKGNLFIDSHNKTAMICMGENRDSWKARIIGEVKLTLKGDNVISLLKKRDEDKLLLTERIVKKTHRYGKPNLLTDGFGYITFDGSNSVSFIGLGGSYYGTYRNCQLNLESFPGNIYIDVENNTANIFEDGNWNLYEIEDIELELLEFQKNISEIKKEESEKELLCEKYVEIENGFFDFNYLDNLMGGNIFTPITMDGDIWTTPLGGERTIFGPPYTATGTLTFNNSFLSNRLTIWDDGTIQFNF